MVTDKVEFHVSPRQVVNWGYSSDPDTVRVVAAALNGTPPVADRVTHDT